MGFIQGDVYFSSGPCGHRHLSHDGPKTRDSGYLLSVRNTLQTIEVYWMYPAHLESVLSQTAVSRVSFLSSTVLLGA